MDYLYVKNYDMWEGNVKEGYLNGMHPFPRVLGH